VPVFIGDPFDSGFGKSQNDGMFRIAAEVAIVNELLRRDGSFGLRGVSASGGVVDVDSFTVRTVRWPFF